MIKNVPLNLSELAGELYNKECKAEAAGVGSLWMDELIAAIGLLRLAGMSVIIKHDPTNSDIVYITLNNNRFIFGEA